MRLDVSPLASKPPEEKTVLHGATSWVGSQAYGDWWEKHSAGGPRQAVWPGTILTTALLLVLSAGYGVYVELSGTSVAGVASSALLLIVLIYFAAQVLLYGAEVIKVQSRRPAG